MMYTIDLVPGRETIKGAFTSTKFSGLVLEMGKVCAVQGGDE
ncbi:MAG: hypothetical protein ACXQTD_01585 [Candidatus Syntropharchaeia archaeon]